MIMDIEDILVRIENSHPVDDSWHDLRCRLTDCANEIQTLRAKVASADVLVEALREIANADVRNTHKVEKCSHDKYGYEDCEQCVYDYAESALATYDKLSEVKHDTK